MTSNSATKVRNGSDSNMAFGKKLLLLTLVKKQVPY